MLDVTTQGRIGILSINRPQRRNAMDRDLVAALVGAFRRFDADPDIAAIVLTGESPGFCAGSDLKFIGRLSLEEMCRFEAETGDMARLIGFVRKPVIAAVEGFALGGGFILAVSCDLVVSSDSARWHLPEVPIGWLTPWGLGALVARVGAVSARKLCFASEAFDGREAMRLGVVDHLAESGRALETAIALAQRLADLPAASVSATKRFFTPGISGLSEVLDIEANEVFAGNCRHPVARETLERFGSR
ncbi:enoyl-CoA hydratase/isomerase family protein [Bradyrhizobium lablabi]|uniref:enoyl-CoA hydratase/isomerase family protein n=1 Tax=Bradyrhizobium lablabi TaxID=722472 RepID=UPI001BAA2995|nr:enoyl-CoA hydratase/isomerase family protein [Bradyrhizobium lablabi]MBR1125138.1 enoyl-CoA hydratase/isomerase family protein [Bradyrhizobium lablabi]